MILRPARFRVPSSLLVLRIQRNRPRFVPMGNEPVASSLSGLIADDLACRSGDLSRNDSLLFGDHTRPRVCRPAPSPVGASARRRTEWCGLRVPRWVARGRAIPHARARALPIHPNRSGLALRSDCDPNEWQPGRQGLEYFCSDASGLITARSRRTLWLREWARVRQETTRGD